MVSVTGMVHCLNMNCQESGFVRGISLLEIVRLLTLFLRKLGLMDGHRVNYSL
mgnify:CR=1 FL=1